MSERLQITLDEEATKKYLDWAGAQTEAEVNEDIEPSGVTISIRIAAPWGADAFSYQNGEKLIFGEVDVELVST